jgi:hypothetical protein
VAKTAVPIWNSTQFGCPERDAFLAQSRPRTGLSEIEGANARTAAVDPTATIEAQITLVLTGAQYAAWQQFVRYDLAGGAVPFMIDLWWFDHVETVRARLLGPYGSVRRNFMTYEVNASVEIERESV